jgi:hypothetical protein
VHSTSFSIKDSGGTSFSQDANFVVPTYPTVSPSFAVTGVDTSKVGFKVRTYQTAAAQPNTIAWTEEQLAGLHGPNTADLTQTIGGTKPDANGYWTYTDVINWDKDGSADGNFQAGNGYQDIVFPGMPGINGDYNNLSIEVLTFVQLPAGFVTMGVNSDDGFKLTVGTNPKDQLASVVLGIFDGGRGSADTTFKMWVPTAGIYPFRLVYENGGSGANCEWFSVQPDKTKILINDPSSTNTSGIKVYYTGPVAPAYVGTFSQSPRSLTIQIVDAGTQVTASSVKLSVNGSSVTTTGGKTNGVTTVVYTPTAPFASGSTNSVTLLYADNTSATITNNAKFVTTPYATIDPSWAVTGVDTTKPGFKVRTYQTAAAEPNSMTWLEQQLAGKQGTNTADLTQTISGGKVGADGFWNYTDVINWDKDGSADGNFQASNGYQDTVFPGMPGINGDYANLGMEILTFLQLPAGFTTLGVNSDDGFRATAGLNPAIYPPGVVLGEFNGGRGSADTTFPFYVQQAGIYRFRLIYENGGSGANCELFSVQPDGTKVLVNDPSSTNKTGIKAFYSGPPPPTNLVTTASFTKVTVADDHRSATLTYTGTLQQGDAVNGPYTDVPGAVSPATVPIATTGSKFYHVH